MYRDLDELRQRAAWCRQKLEMMAPEIVKIGNQSIKHWCHLIQPGSGVIKASLLAHPPVSIRADVGMIVNEQRTILDALTGLLATRNGANHINNVNFPITKTKEGFFEPSAQRRMKKLSKLDQQKIEDLKPWWPSEDNPEDGNPALFLLHEADRVRKHQKLLRWACLGGAVPVGSGHIETMSMTPVLFDQLGTEEELCSFLNITCQLQVQFQLVFREPEALHGRAVLPCLWEFDRTVSSIIESFA